MIVTKNTDETRLYRDLSVQSNDATSIKKIIKTKKAGANTPAFNIDRIEIFI